MKLDLRVFDNAYNNVLGDGPVICRDATLRRKLDEAGSAKMTLFATDPRTIDLVRQGRFIQLQYSSRNDMRTLGVYRVDAKQVSVVNRTMTLTCTDAMIQLAEKMTLPGLVYENEDVASVMTDLASLAGWTALPEAGLSSQYISVRFAGESVLKAMQVVAESQGLHLRLGDTWKRIEVGAFGADAGVWVDFVEGDGGEQHRSGDLLMVEKMSIKEESADIVNWALVRGGGNGDAALTLERSTRPFVEQTTVNGQTHYIIKDDASIAKWGRREKPIDIKRISPTTTSDASKVNAANALADGGKATLDRMAQPYKSFDMSVRNVTTSLKPGDKLNMRVKSQVDRQGNPVTWIDEAEELWIMAVEEQVSSSGLTNRLTVATIDRYQTDAAQIIVGAVDGVNVQNVGLQPYPSYFPYPSIPGIMDDSTPVHWTFNFSESILDLIDIEMVLIRAPFVATARAASTTTTSDSAPHRHRVLKWNFTSGTAYGSVASAWNDFSYATNSGGSSNSGFFGTFAARDIWTFDAGGVHDHTVPAPDIIYGPVADTEKPVNVDVTVNGDSVATGLFMGSDDVVRFDVTEAILNKAGGFQGDHDIDITCDSGQGMVYGLLWVRAFFTTI